MTKPWKSLQERSVLAQQVDGPEDWGRLQYGGCKGWSRDGKDIAQKCKDQAGPHPGTFL